MCAQCGVMVVPFNSCCNGSSSHHAIVTNTAEDLSVGGGRVVVSWDTVEKNPVGMFSFTNDERISILQSGLYEVKATLVTSADSVAEIHWMTIFKVSDTTTGVTTPISSDVKVPIGGYYSSLHATRLVRLNAGDYLYVEYGNATGATITLYSANTLASLDSGLGPAHFSAVKISD